jgi:hypothetical protein
MWSYRSPDILDTSDGILGYLAHNHGRNVQPEDGCTEGHDNGKTT